MTDDLVFMMRRGELPKRVEVYQTELRFSGSSLVNFMLRVNSFGEKTLKVMPFTSFLIFGK